MRVSLKATFVMWLVWIALVLLWVLSSGTPQADGQAPVPEASPFLTACAVAQGIAATEELTATRCRRVSEAVDGNKALVTVRVWILDRGKFDVTTSLLRSEWGMTGLRIAPSS